MSQVHVPIGVLAYNAQLILSAAQTNSVLAARLPANYLGDAVALYAQVNTQLSQQKNAHGELGTLTTTQHTKLETLNHWINKARKSAKLAFPGQSVKLHQEFQVGVNTPHDLGSVLSRTDIIIASIQNETNLPILQGAGWTNAETEALITARNDCTAIKNAQQNIKGGAKVATTTKNAIAHELLHALLIIQNAADLQWPEKDHANLGIRDQFRLNTFPPSNSTPHETPENPKSQASGSPIA